MIILVEVTDIINAVEKHGRPFDAQTEGEAGVPLGVDAPVLEDPRVDHAAGAQLDPSRALAHAAAATTSLVILSTVLLLFMRDANFFPI